MLSCEEYLEKIEKGRAQIRELQVRMERAGIGDIGNYQNEIDRIEDLISYYQVQYRKCQNAKTPDEVTIYFYVIVSIKEKVKAHMGDKLFELFDETRYHASEVTQWKPFTNQSNILELLAGVIEKYEFEPIFLDGDKEHLIQIDNEIENSIAIIDLFSLYKENEEIAIKFDTNKAGVLFPLCTYLDNELKTKAEFCISCFNLFAMRLQRNISCDFLAREIATKESFQISLTNILQAKFPIKNRSSYQSDVRGINIGFS